MKARYWLARARIEILARQHQEEIERTLEALDVHHQRRLVGGALGGELGVELQFVGCHDAIRAPEGLPPAISAAKVLRAS